MIDRSKLTSSEYYATVNPRKNKASCIQDFVNTLSVDIASECDLQYSYKELRDELEPMFETMWTVVKDFRDNREFKGIYLNNISSKNSIFYLHDCTRENDNIVFELEK